MVCKLDLKARQLAVIYDCQPVVVFSAWSVRQSETCGVCVAAGAYRGDPQDGHSILVCVETMYKCVLCQAAGAYLGDPQDGHSIIVGVGTVWARITACQPAVIYDCQYSVGSVWL